MGTGAKYYTVFMSFVKLIVTSANARWASPSVGARWGWYILADAWWAAIRVIIVAEVIDFAVGTVVFTTAAVRTSNMDAFVLNFTAFAFARHEILVTRTA